MKILLVRHGETEWNGVNRLQGHLDSPVTARGHRQIAALIRALDGEKIDRVVSSPAGRAVAAATPIAAYFACPIRFDARLIERGFGPLEGTVYSQLNDEQRRLFDAIYSGDPHVTPPHGESLAAAVARTTAALLEAGEAGDRCVCVVSHGQVMQAVISTLDGHGAENFPRYAHLNGSYSVLERAEGRLSLVKWGIATHLLLRG
ncbi:TPA: histidine phosphatase family protein [Raoultella planticola]|uniref:Histidine phosphatase family protein n=1 Tax=Raoultella planticola TaxID=575 RepID=A0ABU5M1P6_RAOPL|nr:histidine phosphatase family protein [Raoultella planticola]MDW4553295.1 histidine phosphatase family protein [Raoultella planticola]MDZ7447398.1 histidine phosphatase family protein [Raoultella planticola]MDZ7465935.1 histidine phosphatase family protein [Raoultella planticola]MDZ7507246.1 histidine phosphatase family protein [Raoultella planticola]MEA5395454.1 histidine phosphatase family protein [Raoultella planticola]